MPERHQHVINGQFMMRILDYDTMTVGCEACGPQWVVTTNWTDHTLSIAWVNAPLRIFFDAERMLIIPDNDCPTWQPPRGPDQDDDVSTRADDA